MIKKNQSYSAVLIAEAIKNIVGNNDDVRVAAQQLDIQSNHY
ncbi:hypothetical protein [Psychrobacter sp. SWN149]|nr:hypothetical protein [Psychrobacter sp. SWN149]